MGWHGTKALWNIKKMDQLDALNITIRRILDTGLVMEEENPTIF